MGVVRAIRHHAFGAPDVLVLEDVADPDPAPGQLRVAVAAAGVHLLDTTLRAGEPGPFPRPRLPVVPGREVAGRVDAVGDGVDPGWVGAEVTAHLGPVGGGYAELAVVAADRAHRLPPGMDPALGVAAIGTGRTVAAVLELAPVGPGDVVAVPGAAGGMGLLLLQGVRAAGATAVAVAGGEAKTHLVRQVGADVVLDHTVPGWQAGLPDLTVVLDGVAGDVGRALRDRLVGGGRVVPFGWADGAPLEQEDPGHVVVPVLGPPVLDRLAHFEAAALAALADGSRVPHVGVRLPLARAADAHRALEGREAVGKVVLLPR